MRMGAKVAGLALVLGLGVVDAAEARLVVCNKTADAARVALGVEQEKVWLSRGWWTVPAGGCATLIEAPLANLEYYLRAKPVAVGKTGWGGEFPFCVGDKDFQIKGDQDCETRGHKTDGFFILTTEGATAVTHNLTD